MTKAFLITIRIHHSPHDYNEHPIVYAKSEAKARELVWAYLQCGYIQGADPGEWTIENKETLTIEEAYGDRLYTVHNVYEITISHAQVLACHMAWDATEDALRAVETLKTYAPTKE